MHFRRFFGRFANKFFSYSRLALAKKTTGYPKRDFIDQAFEPSSFLVNSYI
jgi:hypothetical protein